MMHNATPTRVLCAAGRGGFLPLNGRTLARRPFFNSLLLIFPLLIPSIPFSA